MCYTVIVPFYCIVRVRAGNAGGIEKDLLRYEIFEGSMADGTVSFASSSARSGFVSDVGRSIP